jgi:hypothetical protein
MGRGKQREKTGREAYDAGGARGEVARGMSEEGAIAVAAASSDRTADITVMTGDGVTTAAPSAEQTGQMCVPVDEPVTSAQKCSCAPRRTIASSRAIAQKECVRMGMNSARALRIGVKMRSVKAAPPVEGPSLRGARRAGSTVWDALIYPLRCMQRFSNQIPGLRVYTFTAGCRSAVQ